MAYHSSGMTPTFVITESVLAMVVLYCVYRAVLAHDSAVNLRDEPDDGKEDGE